MRIERIAFIKGQEEPLMKAPRSCLLILGPIGAFLLLCGATVVIPAVMFVPPMAYAVAADFQELPPTDDELKQWLFDQPGVYIGVVSRNGNSLHVVWGHSRTHFWDPVTPNVRAEFERFGYKGLMNYHEEQSFRDK
jgi:hypothetical protein